MLRRVDIQDAVKKRMFHEEHKLEKEYSITKDSIRRQLALVGFTSMKKLATWKDNKVTIKDEKEMTDDEAFVLKIIRKSESWGDTGGSESFAFEMKDSVKCLELLGKSVGLFDADEEGSGEDSGAGESAEAEISKTIKELQK